MGFLSIAHTDIGIRKNVNQDSVLIKEADTDYGKIHLSVICDGMGGLAKGEVASAALVRAFSRWFAEEFPFILYKSDRETQIDYNTLQKSWNQLIDDANKKIAAYAENFQSSCGTTVTALLLAKQHYYIVNIGDSRVYYLDGSFKLLTKDQTFVQQEVDAGRMSEKEAQDHPKRNVLLQCVGASSVIVPDFYEGSYQEGDIFLLCSDGFRHLVTQEEFLKLLTPQGLITEKAMKDAAVYYTELNKQRKERDNISVIITRVV